jgi:hypothetical protein
MTVHKSKAIITPADMRLKLTEEDEVRFLSLKTR